MAFEMSVRWSLSSPNSVGVEYTDPKFFKVSDVPRHDLKVMDKCRRGNHRIFEQGIRTSVHELRPRTERSGIHWQDVPRGGYLISPSFDLCRFGDVLFARDFDPRLDFAERNG
jgi:hypothetical protein